MKMTFPKLFLNVLDRTLIYEGGYSNRKSDSGGETYMGISRKYNPKWEGWSILDKIPNKENGAFFDNENLKSMVYNFYYKKYWSMFSSFEKLSVYSHIWDDDSVNRLVGLLFNFSVLFGVNRIFKLLQASMNSVFKTVDNGKNVIKVDGLFGDNSIKALVEAKRLNKVDTIIANLASMLLGISYNNTITNKKNLVYIDGWVNRIVTETKYALGTK